MLTAEQFAGIVLVGFGVGMFIPRALQRRRVRKQLRATVLADLRHKLTFVTAQRDELIELNRAQGTTITAYRNSNVRLVDFIRDQQEEAGWVMPDLWDASVVTPTFFDAAAQQSLDWLDAQTWGQQ